MTHFYILTAKMPDGSHEYIFSDYDYETVEQEIFDCRDFTDYDEYTDFKIHELENDDIDFQDFVQSMNSEFVQCRGI